MKCGVVSGTHCWRGRALIVTAVVAAAVFAAVATVGTARSHAGGRDSLCTESCTRALSVCPCVVVTSWACKHSSG